MRKVVIRPGQTVFDLALQEYGAAEGALFIAQDNNLDGWQTSPGQTVSIRDEPLSGQIVLWHHSQKHHPAGEVLQPTGRDFSNDFNTDYR